MNSLFAYIGDEPCKQWLWEGITRCPEGAVSGMAIQTEDGLSLRKTDGDAAAQQRINDNVKGDGRCGLAAVTEPLQSPVAPEAAAPYVRDQIAVAADGSVSPADAEALLQALHDVAPAGILALLKKQLTEQIDSVIVLASEEACLYCRAGVCPLYIAIAAHGFFITDTLTALPEEAVRFHLLQKGESARITRERVTIYDARLRKIKKPLRTPDESSDTAGVLFPDSSPLSFPLSVKAVVSRFVRDGVLVKEAVCPIGRSLQRVTKVVLIGSGIHCLTAKMAAPHFTALADLPCDVFESREPALTNLLMDKGTLLIAVAPKGRDDAAARCLERGKRLGALTVAVTQSPFSQLALTASHQLILPSGNSIVTAYLALSFLTLYIGNRYEVISDVYCSVAVQLATMLTGKVSSAVRAVPPLQHLSGKINRAGTVITAGIGADFAVAEMAAADLRRSLQLPVFAQSLFALAGEESALLHGSLILTFLTDSDVTAAILPALHRLLHSGAEVVMITTESIASDLPETLPVVTYPDSIPLFNPLICLAGFRKIAASAKELPDAEVI